MSNNYEGAVSHALVQEDVGNTFDVRSWTARPQVAGRDGPSLAPNDSGVFSRLEPNCQYRIVSKGTRNPEALSASPDTHGAAAMVYSLDEQVVGEDWNQ